jgi:hypothetical protein
VLGLGIVCVLTGIYFTWNQHAFGSWLPLSGVAKGLKTSLMPSQQVLSSLFRPKHAHQFFMVFIPFVATLLGILFWLIWGAPWNGRQRWVTGWMLCFPAAYYVILMLRSDWPLWSWYYYPLPLAGIVAMRILFQGVMWPIKTVGRRWLPHIMLMLAVVYVGVSVIRVLMLTPYSNPCYRTALCIEAFAKEHSGIYAMGDQAGLTSFITGLRVVQVEGLVCDRAMIEHIKMKANLRDVLKAYGADYYVTVQSLKQRGACYETHEPSQAGELSAKMIGVFCGPPALLLHYPDSRTVSVFCLADVL